MGNECCIAVCSPRRQGNCVYASGILQQSINLPCRKIFPAHDLVQPCTACGYCSKNVGSCILDASPYMGRQDRAAELFTALCSSALSILVIPIYFYHVPAQIKAWIDRSQCWWAVQNPKDRPGYGHTLTAVMLGARPRGEKLFEGAERTLRYMAGTLGMAWRTPLCLYGLDEPGALAKDKISQNRIRDFAIACEQDTPQV